MNLERVGNALFISEEECRRLVELLKEGRNLYYEEPFVKVAIDGHTKQLQFYGLKTIPMLFAQKDGKGGIKYCDTYTKELKNLVKSIVICEGSKDIVYYAFNEFENVEKVSLPSTLEVIDSSFVNCLSLKDIKLPNGLKEIKGEAFFNVPLESIEIPKGITEIHSAFKYTNIKHLTIPKTVKKLYNAFYGSKELESVVFEDGSVDVIGYDTFNSCSKLRKVILPDLVITIGDYAFANCESLESINIPKDCKVSNNAFYNTPYNETLKREKLNKNAIKFNGNIGEDLFKRMKKVLKGKMYSEQLEYFVLSECDECESYSYGEVTGGKSYVRVKPVYDVRSIDNVIVYKDIVVGVVIDNKTLIIDKPICTYYASEDDGVGSRSVEVYTTLKFNK